MIPGFFSAGAARASGSKTVVLDMPFTSDLLDLTGKPVTNVGGCTFDPTDGADGLGCLLTPNAGYLSVDADAKVGSGPFDISFWMKVTSPANQAFFPGAVSFEALLGADFNLLTLTTGSNPCVWSSTNSAGWNIFATESLPAISQNAWHHYRYTRVGNFLRLFLDGVLAKEREISGSILQRGPTTILGAKGDGLTAPATVKFQHLKITKG